MQTGIRSASQLLVEISWIWDTSGLRQETICNGEPKEPWTCWDTFNSSRWEMLPCYYPEYIQFSTCCKLLPQTSLSPSPRLKPRPVPSPSPSLPSSMQIMEILAKRRRLLSEIYLSHAPAHRPTASEERKWPNDLGPQRNYNKFMFRNAINSMEFLIWFCHLRSISPRSGQSPGQNSHLGAVTLRYLVLVSSLPENIIYAYCWSPNRSDDKWFLLVENGLGIKSLTRF